MFLSFGHRCLGKVFDIVVCDVDLDDIYETTVIFLSYEGYAKSFDDVIIDGNLDELKFAAYYIR